MFGILLLFRSTCIVSDFSANQGDSVCAVLLDLRSRQLIKAFFFWALPCLLPFFLRLSSRAPPPEIYLPLRPSASETLVTFKLPHSAEQGTLCPLRSFCLIGQ